VGWAILAYSGVTVQTPLGFQDFPLIVSPFMVRQAHHERTNVGIWKKVQMVSERLHSGLRAVFWYKGVIYMNRIESIEYIHNLQLAMIHAADSKLYLVMPLATAMLGSLALIINNNWLDSSNVMIVLLIIDIFSLTGSIVFCGISATPRVVRSQNSLISFDEIKRFELKEHYINKISISTDEDYKNALQDHCYSSAVIASKKFKNVSTAIILLITGAVLWSIMLSVTLIHKLL
jgi:hypothetical protein